MKIYFQIIRTLQTTMLAIGIFTLVALPLYIALSVSGLTGTVSNTLYSIAHATLFFVMIIRPLADLFTNTKWIRPLVQLRKGAGVISASIVVSFLLSKIIMSPAGYFSSLLTSEYWSIHNLNLLAHLADITGVLLLVTSNNFSKRVLGANWKRLQRLSYVFFFASGIYVFSHYDDLLVLNYMFIVAILTTWAFIKKRI